MADTKKILILYASAGHGHEKAARAVCEALSEEDPAAQVVLVDSLEWTRGFFGQGYRRLYLFLIQHSPYVWGLFYYLADNPLFYFFIRPLRRLTNAFAAKPLEQRVLKEDPDVVVSTHFLPTEVVSHLKKRGRSRAMLLTVVTDYMAHAFWLASGVDVYAVSSSETQADLRRRGVSPEKVVVTGIPIEKKFREKLSREELRARYGIADGNFAALITSGGAGIGSMHGLVRTVLSAGRHIDILAVCGTNKHLLHTMNGVAADHAQLHVFGFVDNIHELMAVSDVVIGKGGGLTVSESLSMGRPMILFGSLPGQETRNAQCLVRHGAARIAPSFSDVLRFLIEFSDSRSLLQEYTHAALAAGRPEAARTVASMALSASS